MCRENDDKAETGCPVSYTHLDVYKRQSQKTARGKHTTRHVEIFEIDGGGMIFDTPGFTSFDAPEADEDNLRECYPEMDKFHGKCRYDDCRHLSEPGCAVREAVEEGRISPVRYGNYKAYMDELKNRKKY